ncbi:MAG TPA: alpha/beta hydrolase [Gillisia sp.]|nr:alpha/beta hydrolase [Gillisia sp.]
MPKKHIEKIPVQVLLTPAYILITGKILTALSPFLASRFAARLFLSPFRYKLPNREKEMDKKSVQETINIPSINRKIVVYKYGTGPKKVLLVHGWSGSGTQLSVIAKELVNKGFSVISFDAPAHGKAPGKTSMMPFFIESIHHIDKEYGPFDAAIGHSLGGMSLLKAVKDGFKVNKLVLIGTANSVTHITRKFAKNMKLNEKVAKLMKTYFDKKFGEDMDNYSGAFSAESVKVATLVVHDKNDIDVHISSAHEIVAKLENGKLFVTEGLGHRKILGNPDVINKISTFITE